MPLAGTPEDESSLLASQWNTWNTCLHLYLSQAEAGNAYIPSQSSSGCVLKEG